MRYYGTIVHYNSVTGIASVELDDGRQFPMSIISYYSARSSFPQTGEKVIVELNFEESGIKVGRKL